MVSGVAQGHVVLSFCLTEWYCGSDAAAIRSTAVRDGADWVLNGAKCWIGNALRADVTVVAVKTDPTAGNSVELSGPARLAWLRESARFIPKWVDAAPSTPT